MGDCREKMLRQVATAVGDGAIAGFMAEKYVEELEYVQKEIFEAEGLVMAYIYNAAEAVVRAYLTQIEQEHKNCNGKIQLRRIDIYKSDRIACRLEYTKSPSVIFMKQGEILEKFEDLTKVRTVIKEMIKKYCDCD